MPTNNNNLSLINQLENDLRDQLIWLARDAINQTSSVILNYRNLRQLMIGLSVAAVGIVFPTMIANDIFKNNDYFISSLF